MKQPPGPFSTQMQENYILLLEKSNTRLYHKNKKIKQLFFLFSFLFAISWGIYYTYFLHQTAEDIFAEHLTQTAFSPRKILFQTPEGNFYEINKTTTASFLLPDGIFFNITGNTMQLQNKKKKNDVTYTLYVPAQKNYRLILPDQTHILVNANTRISFADTRIGVSQHVALEGEAYFKVHRDPQNPFFVKAGKMKVKVLGTEFNLKNNTRIDQTQLALINGTVQVSNDKTRLVIKPGQEVVLKHDAFKIVKPDLPKVVKWTAHTFHFEKQKLENIVKIIEQWYGVHIQFDDEKLKNIQFTGTVKKEEGLIYFLQMLYYTENIQYNIEGKHIILSKSSKR